MLNDNKKIEMCKWLLQYSLTFCALCVANHCFSVTLFTMCGYCIFTYAFAFTFFLTTFSLFLSSAVYYFLAKREEKNKVLEDLRAVSYEDIPRVMVWLINKAKARETKTSCANQNDITRGELCVACYESQPSIKNIPCGHSVLCRSCNWNLLRISIENRAPLICPWCRSGIQDFHGEMGPDFQSIEWKDVKDALLELEMLKAKRHRSAGAI